MTTEELESIVLDLRYRVARLENVAINDVKKSATAEIAPDSDLDSQYGNPAVRKDPPLWIKNGGTSHLGDRFSDCPPEYLEALAGFFDWKATKDAEKKTEDGDKYARYARKDAARARGWAARIRAGWNQKQSAPTDAEWTDSDDGKLPF